MASSGPLHPLQPPCNGFRPETHIFTTKQATKKEDAAAHYIKRLKNKALNSL